jgi:PIN domain nuclease of toxin-antitoxin system
MSVYVTDTHPLIWHAANEKAKLSRKALRVFERAWANQAFIYVPAPVLWGIALLIKAGQIRLPQPFAQWEAALGNQPGFEIALLNAAVLETSLNVRINGDPFDEVIVATALTLNLPLITKNVAITDSQLVEVIW